VRVTAHGKRQTASQARAYLLCSDCEKLFDQNGQDYAMRQCYRGRVVFRLRETVEKLTPMDADHEFPIYPASAASEIAVEKLVYFAPVSSGVHSLGTG
jgi:hypothetical protein